MTVRDATAGDLDTICDLIEELAAYERLEHEVTFDRDEVRHHLFGERPVAFALLAETEAGAGATVPVPEPSAGATVSLSEADAGAGETVAGMALWFPTFSTFLGRPGIWLEDLFVRPEHRGRGHGLALLEALRARTDGRVEWAVLDWNEPSIEFYRRLGARPVEGWTRYRWAPAQ